MGSDALAKLTKAGEAAYRSLSKKWDGLNDRHSSRKIDAEKAEAVRQKNEFLQLVSAKLTGTSVVEMAPLVCDPRTPNKAVFFITTPISFGNFELSKKTWKLLARHVGMGMDSVNHWAVVVIDRALGLSYCYDLMSDRMELNMLGKSYFRVNEVTPEFIQTWSTCYYVGETMKKHEEIQELGLNLTAVNPRYNLISNNCQHLVESLVRVLCDGKVISQGRLDEELNMISPKLARDIMVARLRSKLDVEDEKEDSDTVQGDVSVIKDLWHVIKHR